MKAKIIICTAVMLICLPFFAVPAFATEKSTRASAIVSTLERYQVSPDWQPDIKSNFTLLDELYALVNSFEQQDIDATGTKYDSIKKYYTAYCKAKGIDASLPSSYSQSTSAYVPPQAGSCRAQANEILSVLIKGGVDYRVDGDITANINNIEAMLLLVYDYTEEELNAVSVQEQQSMLNYFTGLYKYRGWDLTELDLLFTTTLLPNEGVVLAPAVPPPAPVPPVQNITPPVNDVQSAESSLTKQNNDFITGFVALLLWFGLLAAIVLFLKQRTEKHGKA